MAKQPRKNDIKRKRAIKRLKKLDKAGRLVLGVEIPENTIPANPYEQNAAGYSVKYFYRDIEFRCARCRQKSVWTGVQQQRYFETQKGNIYNQPKWCTPCHKIRQKRKESE